MRGLNDFKREGILSISLCVFTIFLLLPYPSFSEEKVQYLKKVGEIKDGFSSERENFFIKITGLCCDDEGNLYVADSGWNKIFKFDSNGKFLMSFGREGQGPGEFMGQRMSNHLKISFGNDGKLYVNDPGNSRISVFTKEGKFLKSHRTPPFTYDTPVVNSRGDIYLFSKSGIKAIDCYDSNFKYKGSLLDMEEHLQFPFGKPFSKSYDVVLEHPLFDLELLKFISSNDKLIVVSNLSFKIFVFDSNNKKEREFRFENGEFIKDYKAKIKEFKEKEEKIEKKKLSEGALLLSPLIGFISRKNGNLWLFYKMKEAGTLLYIFKPDKGLVEKSLINFYTFPKFITSNSNGELYIVKNYEAIEIYEGGLR
jgi:hypothetical protein